MTPNFGETERVNMEDDFLALVPDVEPEISEEFDVEESTPKTDSGSIRMVAEEVVAGRWSRGNVRKARLAAAGYDPAEVEAEVQKIFNGS